MLDLFIKKHSRLCALASILLCFVAAPYLVPENPDSAVFRSGTLSFLLLLATYAPIQYAYAKQTSRTLAFSLLWGLLFAFGLSIGSELVVYDGLLPGMGSLIRRLCIPFMSMPFFGALISHVFSFVPREKKDDKPLPFWFFFLCFSLCYTLVLLAFYPGVIAYDFEHEIRQFTTGVYEAAHPVFHTLFLGSLYTLGEKLFGSMNGGAALYSAVQLLLLAAMYAWCCAFVQKRLPRPVVLILAACFALLPFHGVLAVSTSKDPLFAGLCAMLCLSLWELWENPADFLLCKAAVARFILVSLFMCLLRHNAIAAVIPALLGVLILARTINRRSILLVLVTFIAIHLIPHGLEAALHASKLPSSEMMSVPCQQLMRTAEYADVTDEEFEELNSYFSGVTFRYRPHCADPAKGGNFAFDRFQKDPDAFWSMYWKYAKAYPRTYVEAFLENCIGLLNPDDISHANSLGGEEWDFVYMNTAYSYAPDRYALNPHPILPRLHRLLYAFTHFSKHQKYPLLAQLFCPATYTFLLLLATLMCLEKRRKSVALSLLPLWGIWATLLFSAGIFVRYAYPLMAAVPFLFALILFMPSHQR